MHEVRGVDAHVGVGVDVSMCMRMNGWVRRVLVLLLLLMMMHTMMHVHSRGLD